MSARDAIPEAPAANRWPIATAHLQRGVPGLRYPRTMAEAFPDTTEYACAVTRPAVGPGGERWLYAACAVIGFAASAAGFPRIGCAAALVGAGVACWRMARSER